MTETTKPTRTRRGFIQGFISGTLGGIAALTVMGMGVAMSAVECKMIGPPKLLQPTLIHGSKFSLFAYRDDLPDAHKIAMADHVADMARQVIGAPESELKWFSLFMEELRLLDWEPSHFAGSLTSNRVGGTVTDMLHWRIKPFYWQSIELDLATLERQPMTALHWGSKHMQGNDVFTEKLAAVTQSTSNLLAA